MKSKLNGDTEFLDVRLRAKAGSRMAMVLKYIRENSDSSTDSVKDLLIARFLALAMQQYLDDDEWSGVKTQVVAENLGRLRGYSEAIALANGIGLAEKAIYQVDSPNLSLIDDNSAVPSPPDYSYMFGT